MRRRAFTILSIAALSSALAGCSSWGNPLTGAYSNISIFNQTPGPPPEPNIVPAKYRENLLIFLEREFFDPTGVRDAYITEPKLMLVGGENRYVVCVRYNAKNGYGQYAGVRDYTAIYFNGDLTQYIPAAPGQCASAA